MEGFQKKTSRPHLLNNKHAKGKIPWNKNKKGLQVAWNKGISHEAIKGNNNGNWKGGWSQYYLKTKERVAGRERPEICEVCGAFGNIEFDHNHNTGKFRGWICHRCNWLLGLAKDNSELLIALSNYIKNDGFFSKHNGDQEDIQP